MAQQPPPAPPPPPPTGPGPGFGAAPYGARPGGITAAGVILIILGALYALFGIIAAIGGGALAGQFGGLGGAVILIGLIVVAFGVLDIIAGVKVFGLSSGWRIGGIVLAAIGALFALLGTLGSFGGTEELDPQTFEITQGGPNVSGIIFGLVFLAANLFVLIQLARSGRYFTR